MDQASTIGQGPNSRRSIGLSNRNPMIAAGTNAMSSASSSRRPLSCRPSTPSAISPTRRRYSPSTATMAPAWITIA